MNTKVSTIMVVFSLGCLGIMTTGCAAWAREVQQTPTPESVRLFAASDVGLFLDAPDELTITPAPTFSRVRPVKINLSLLLNDAGESRPVSELSALVLNLFPDVVYTGVVDDVQFDGVGYSWIGHLKDVEYSYFTLMFTGEVFIANIGSPAGVYEVSILREGIYLIVQMDQNKLEGGDG